MVTLKFLRDFWTWTVAFFVVGPVHLHCQCDGHDSRPAERPDGDNPGVWLRG